MSVKERPILFSGPMVRAILEGRKTQTRRVVKSQPSGFIKECYARPDGRFIWLHLPKGVGVGMGPAFDCPYGVSGDRLWVREAWREMPDYDQNGELIIRTDYKADNPYSAGPAWPWRPSIHMPRSSVISNSLGSHQRQARLRMGCEPLGVGD